jgi:hypothetical protein
MTIATVLATWATTFMRQKTTELELAAEERLECEKAGARIENAVYDDAGDSITAVIWNDGDINLTNWRFNVYYSEVNITPRFPANANLTLAPGEYGIFTVTDITQTPIKIRLQSMLCPKVNLYECSFHLGEFRC